MIQFLKKNIEYMHWIYILLIPYHLEYGRKQQQPEMTSKKES